MKGPPFLQLGGEGVSPPVLTSQCLFYTADILPLTFLLFGLAALKLGYNFTFLEHVLTKIMPVCNVNIFTSVVRRSCSSSHHFFVGSGSTSDQDLFNPA